MTPLCRGITEHLAYLFSTWLPSQKQDPVFHMYVSDEISTRIVLLTLHSLELNHVAIQRVFLVSQMEREQNDVCNFQIKTFKKENSQLCFLFPHVCMGSNSWQ